MDGAYTNTSGLGRGGIPIRREYGSMNGHLVTHVEKNEGMLVTLLKD